MTRAKLKAYAVVLGIFVLGAGAGAATASALSAKRLAEALDDDRVGEREARRLQALARELSLSDEQREKLRAVLGRHREQNRRLTRAMFETCGGDVSKLREQLDGDIRALLSEQQRQRFAELAQKRGRRFPFGGVGPKQGREERR